MTHRTFTRHLARSPSFAGLYLHELLLLANLVAAHVVFAFFDVPVRLSDIVDSIRVFGPVVLGAAGSMLLARLVIAALRRQLGAMLRIISTPAWLLDTARHVVATSLLIHAYSYVKLMVPLMNGRSWDQALWDLDHALFFGMSPNVFFLNLFDPFTLRLFDISYEKVYLTLLNIAIGLYLSSPSERFRRAFAGGSVALWMSGAWLYLIFPAIGPCYRFPELWAQSNLFEHSRQMQYALLQNYRAVLQMAAGTPVPVNVAFGVAAFPSLHVGLALILARFVRLAARPFAVLFEIFAAIMFIASLATGWHYMVDSIAGALLALLFFAAVARIHRLHHWRKLRTRLSSARFLA